MNERIETRGRGVGKFTQEFIDELSDRIADRVVRRISGNATRTGLLSVPQAAQRLGRTPDAVYQMIQRGQIPVVKHGRRVHIEASAIDAYIEQGRIG